MTEIAARDASPAGLLALAVEKGANVEQLGQLLDLQERWDKEVARKAFFEAARKVQEEMPAITKDSNNPQTRSKYAKLEAINAVLVPIYTKHGFSAIFGQEDSPIQGHIRIIGDIAHAAGHVERRHVDLPLDDSGIQGAVNKTGVHATGSTLSYGRRYLTCMIFNVSTEDDDDGQQSGRSEIDYLIEHVATVRDWFETIYCIKVAIRDGDLERAVEAAAEMDTETKKALHRAPSKGGIFTTAEREAMNSSEWMAIRRRRIQDGLEGGDPQ